MKLTLLSLTLLLICTSCFKKQNGNITILKEDCDEIGNLGIYKAGDKYQELL